MVKKYQHAAELLKALAHPVRLRIVDGLSKNECNVNKIVNNLGLPQSTISQHLGVLRRCGIIVYRKEGVRTCYRVADDRVKELLVLFNRLLKNPQK